MSNNEIRLPGTIDADSAVSLAAQLRELPRNVPTRLDAVEIKKLSIGYLQILAAALKTCAQMKLANPSHDVMSAFERCGFVPAIEESPPTAVEGQQPDPMQNAATRLAGKRTILTIDDSRTMRNMLAMTLSNAGFEVVQAVDGQDGLDVLSRNHVDVIITDINMPKLDGYGVIREVRKNPVYDATPILVLSTESEQDSKEIAKESGATGWIVKPFDPPGLVGVVNQVCA